METLWKLRKKLMETLYKQTETLWKPKKLRNLYLTLRITAALLFPGIVIRVIIIGSRAGNLFAKRLRNLGGAT